MNNAVPFVPTQTSPSPSHVLDAFAVLAAGMKGRPMDDPFATAQSPGTRSTRPRRPAPTPKGFAIEPLRIFTAKEYTDSNAARMAGQLSRPQAP